MTNNNNCSLFKYLVTAVCIFTGITSCDIVGDEDTSRLSTVWWRQWSDIRLKGSTASYENAAGADRLFSLHVRQDETQEFLIVVDMLVACEQMSLIVHL